MSTARAAVRSGIWVRLGSLAALALLAVPAFGLGAFAGLLWEDPGLVTSYLLGRTDVVAWGPEEVPPEAVEPPAVAAGPPGAATSAAAAPARPAAAAPEKPAAQQAPAPAGRFSVQVGAFADEAGAERLAGTLRGKGYPVYVAAGESSGGARWRVRVGPLATREEGEQTATRLKRDERLPTWVLEEDR